jgi:hypothetical protein
MRMYPRAEEDAVARRQVRVSPAVVQAARLRVAVNDRQNKPTSAVTRRIAEARITGGSTLPNRSAAAATTTNPGDSR